MITQEIALDLFRYDPVTGFLYWRIGRGPVQAGDRAGWFDKSDGYIRIFINGTQYLAHRIIWLMVYGEFPLGDTDHKNQIRHDNRIANLRDVSRSINVLNGAVRADSKSGIRGVLWHKATGKWYPRITINKKRIYLES